MGVQSPVGLSLSTSRQQHCPKIYDNLNIAKQRGQQLKIGFLGDEHLFEGIFFSSPLRVCFVCHQSWGGRLFCNIREVLTDRLTCVAESGAKLQLLMLQSKTPFATKWVKTPSGPATIFFFKFLHISEQNLGKIKCEVHFLGLEGEETLLASTEDK